MTYLKGETKNIWTALCHNEAVQGTINSATRVLSHLRSKLKFVSGLNMNSLLCSTPTAPRDFTGNTVHDRQTELWGHSHNPKYRRWACGALFRHTAVLEPHTHPLETSIVLEPHKLPTGYRPQGTSVLTMSHGCTDTSLLTQPGTILRNQLTLDGKKKNTTTKNAPRIQSFKGSTLCQRVRRVAPFGEKSFTLTSMTCLRYQSFKRKAYFNTQVPVYMGWVLNGPL